jgi:hypothetical protein
MAPLLTNEEKYQKFRELYADSDLSRLDHRRFDALVRLLLNIPDPPPPAAAGQFVISKFDGTILQVTHYQGDFVCGWTKEGQGYRIPIRNAVPIAAWNKDTLEMPF